MKVLACMVCFFTIPGCFFLQNTKGETSDSILKSIVFPKDRTNYPLPKIIGGEEVTPNSFPYQAALYIYMATFSYFCGGTLISPTWVLTAAHCISEDPLYILVNLGAHNLSTSEPHRITFNTTTFVYHPGWNLSTLQHDIGLIRLPTNVTFNENVTTIGYARGSNSYANRIGTISGWGLTEAGGNTISPVLRHVNASIMTNEECANYYQTLIVPSHICTSGTGIVGSCSGDSGGPLTVDGVQVGVVSFGTADCTLGYPSVFARVTDYADWIQQYVTDAGNGNFKCSFTLLIVFCLLQVLVFTSSL